MLSLIALLAVAGPTPPPPKVSIREAVAAAQWFCKCVDVQPPALSSVKLDRHRSYSGVPIYLVIFRAPGDRFAISFEIDADSGDVVHATNYPYSTSTTREASTKTDVWLKRLGRLKGLRRGHDQYDITIDGYPFLNLNGDTVSYMLTDKGKFASFSGPGKMPPRPIGKATVSQSKAEAIAKAEFARTRGSWPYPVVPQSTLGLFYDEKIRQTRWAWQVIEGFHLNGRFSDIAPYYIDAQSGKLIPDDFRQNSMFRYESRPARQGLALVKPLKIEVPALDRVEKKLRQIGRPDVKFDSIEIGEGIRVGQRYDALIEIKANGDLQSFNFPHSKITLTKNQALAKAQQLVAGEHPKLPEGRYMIEPYGNGNPYYKVIYRQTAFGYDYLDNAVVTTWLGGNGGLAKYYVAPAAPRPSGVPPKILSKAQIEKTALAMAQPYVEKDTPTVHYYASVKAGQLGWYIDPATKQARLCYQVDVWFMRDIKNWAVQGGGSSYPFDAVTGKCLRKFR